MPGGAWLPLQVPGLPGDEDLRIREQHGVQAEALPFRGEIDGGLQVMQVLHGDACFAAGIRDPVAHVYSRGYFPALAERDLVKRRYHVLLPSVVEIDGVGGEFPVAELHGDLVLGEPEARVKCNLAGSVAVPLRLMSPFTTQAPVVITCNRRLSPFLEQEVRALGFVPEEVFLTGVKLKASIDECIRLNLSLRCASQVLYSLQEFRAPDGDALYAALRSFPWERYLPAGGYFSVTSNVRNETINNNLFANLRVKDAVVDRLREIRGERPETGADLRGAVIHLHWTDDVAQVFLDTSGNSLGRHGYRRFPGRAPMLEALAAATILATRWDRESPFINPMCGSGTLAIEAALIATDTAPGVFRNDYSFMHLIGYDETVFERERGKLEQAIRERVPGLRIIATDYDKTVLEMARKNARAAGVDDLIEFRLCDFRDTEVPAGGRGVMMVNPEYGERLGEESALEQTYGQIGDFMKNKCGGYWGYVFTGNLELAKHIGLKAKRRIEFYNSKLDARLLEYELYEGSRKRAPEPGRRDD